MLKWSAPKEIVQRKLYDEEIHEKERYKELYEKEREKRFLVEKQIQELEDRELKGIEKSLS